MGKVGRSCHSSPRRWQVWESRMSSPLTSTPSLLELSPAEWEGCLPRGPPVSLLAKLSLVLPPVWTLVLNSYTFPCCILMRDAGFCVSFEADLTCDQDQPSKDQETIVQLSKFYSVKGAPFETIYFHMAAPWARYVAHCLQKPEQGVVARQGEKSVGIATPAPKPQGQVKGGGPSSILCTF